MQAQQKFMNPSKGKYSKTCLNGHLYLKDNLYIKDTLPSLK